MNFEQSVKDQPPICAASASKRLGKFHCPNVFGTKILGMRLTFQLRILGLESNFGRNSGDG